MLAKIFKELWWASILFDSQPGMCAVLVASHRINQSFPFPVSLLQNLFSVLNCLKAFTFKCQLNKCQVLEISQVMWIFIYA